MIYQNDMHFIKSFDKMQPFLQKYENKFSQVFKFAEIREISGS